MWTSNYAIAGREPDAVATSVGVPKWFPGRHYDPLKPKRYMLKLKDEADYTSVYASTILAPLDPYRVIEDLGDKAILLCWERPGEFCHRRLVAEWLLTKTGLVVLEWRPVTRQPGLFDS